MRPVRELEIRDTAPAACCVPLAASEMSDEDAATTATVFKALADPNRVRIVNLLAAAGEAVCVCDLTAQLDLSQPTVSFHLKKLVEAGPARTRAARGVGVLLAPRGARRPPGDVPFQDEGGETMSELREEVRARYAEAAPR